VWAVLAHLSIFVLGILGPLVIWLVKREDSPYTAHHALEALNFHLTLLLATMVSAVLVLVLIGIPMLLVLAVGAVVLAVLATVAAAGGRPYRYPFTLRLVR
jgi:uncharacterized protein